jgi:hypothetical protein
MCVEASGLSSFCSEIFKNITVVLLGQGVISNKSTFPSFLMEPAKSQVNIQIFSLISVFHHHHQQFLVADS